MNTYAAHFSTPTPVSPTVRPLRFAAVSPRCTATLGQQSTPALRGPLYPTQPSTVALPAASALHPRPLSPNMSQLSLSASVDSDATFDLALAHASDEDGGEWKPRNKMLWAAFRKGEKFNTCILKQVSGRECGKQVPVKKVNGTGGMRLQSTHNKYHKEMEAETHRARAERKRPAERAEGSGEAALAIERQSTIRNDISLRPAPTSSQHKLYILRIFQACLESNIPFRSITDSSYFKQLFKQELGFKLPSRWVFTRLLPKYYDKVMARLSDRLSTVEALSITTDSTFLTRHHIPYIAVTGHYIDNSWVLHDSVLTVIIAQQSETGDSIAQEIKDLLSTKLNVSKQLQWIVTDEGANFLNAAVTLKNESVINDSIRCACHRFQLTIKGAIKAKSNQALLQLLNKCQALVLEFNNGWASTKKSIWQQCQLWQIN